MSRHFSSRVTSAPDVMLRIIGDEAVILNLKSETYLGLDPVGTRMWTVLQESPSIQSAYASLLDEFEVEPERPATTWTVFSSRCSNRVSSSCIPAKPPS